MTPVADLDRRPYPALRGWLAVCLLLLTLPGAAAEQPGEGEAIGLLERMLEAMRTLSYSGTFVYLHENQLESLRITHSLRDGQVLERLVSLNGSAREVRSDRRAVTCVMPESRAVAVEQRAPDADLWPQLTPDLRRLRSHYLLHLLGEFRVAGRPARVVGIIPRDKLRYGYRFYLDQESGLPLKTDLMSEEAKPVEQIMFTSLKLAPADDASEQPPQQGGFRKSLRQPPQPRGPDQPSRWEFSGLPDGFALKLQDQWNDDAGHRVEHFLLGDGLASVSVYVERATEEGGLQGGAHVGATNAWGAVVADYQVTAVGEVPAQTVEQVVKSLGYRGGGRDR